MKSHTKVTFFLLLAVTPNVLGLNCHKCSSTKSWEDCSTDLSQLPCPQSDAICYKTHYTTNDGSFQTFGKSCGPESFCEKESNPICKDHLGPSECIVNCCDEDLCNGSPIARVSGLAVMSCILVMILYR
ncbi:uncharacterized protein LOC110043294 [Orbicella faveolata]|uniref:uncharacterized protein LOC110043294 n=1 Tax=Orbicella faveolata TaxID=48498 RepID=UPI0009E3C7A8|nr:uncharacterized protein LOC110043294 [Orbicella faveolata]